MKSVLILIILMISSSLFAQGEEIEFQPPKRVGLAIAETMGINILLWGFNRYIREDNYSFMISMSTVEDNLRHGMEWDPNKFKGNFFDHPFHGSTYFNAARTNGMDFWESTPFVFGGSLMWEIVMESEYPAYNDLLATTFGGIALGEVLFRFSEQVLDDRARGSSRFWRESAGFVLNPIGGFNRLIRGDMSSHSSTVDHIRSPIWGNVALGARTRVQGSGSELGDLAPALGLTLHYGNPFQRNSHSKPFDYFTFRFMTSRGDSTRNTTIVARASLLDKTLGSGGDQHHLLGFFQHYDYVNNEHFKIGAMSFGTGLMSRFELGSEFDLITAPYVGYIVIGAGSNEYVESYQGRDYNYGHGLKGKADLLLTNPTYGELLIDYSYFSIYCREGVSGVDRLHLLDASYIVPVWGDLGIGAEYIYYHRDARYDEFPDVVQTLKGFLALASYSF